ncbi:MAG: CehA/McbA family metallohydrolase [Pseudomonadota bacterium]
MKISRALIVALSTLMLAACGSSSSPDGESSSGPVPTPPTDAARCAPGQPALEFSGSIGSSDAKTYRMLPFKVASGTGRVEVSYGWTDKPGLPSTPLTSTTLDLGLWDQHGYRSNAGFRGWSGSRQGRIDQEQSPVFVEAGAADRGYLPGKIEPGVWYADLGVGASSPQGADWVVKVECKVGGGTTPANNPVDKNHVARSAAGWYSGDFHMHAYHSNPNAPDWDGFIQQARAAKLDFLMVTEYVTTQHWRTLGAVQRANPDLLIYPGREIITYYGHVMGHGETPHVSEYRHGFENVKISDVQKAIKADGALFQINHPTSFPPPLFSNFCRGCYFELGDQIDWDQVDTMEILNGPLLTTADDLGVPLSDPKIENPFMTTALALWDQQLSAGHKITGVSGSDSKGVDAPDQRERKGYGSSATVVYAPELSRTAIKAAIKAGHAYVKTRGVTASPSLQFEASTSDGQHAIFGDTLKVAANGTVKLRTTVTGGMGQLLSYYRNGEIQLGVTLPIALPLPNGLPVPTLAVPITSDPFVHEIEVGRNTLNEGPLGTFWRVETRNLQTRTAISNPIFLKAP